MSRLVEPDTIIIRSSPKRQGMGPASTFGVPKTTEEHIKGSGKIERVAKYIPGEVIAFYIAALGVLNSLDAKETLRIPAALACLLIGLAFTPAYIYRLAGVRDRATLVNALVSTIAFAIWSYSLGGIFTYLGWYVPWLGSLFIAGFTLMTAFIELPARVVKEPS